MLNDHADKSYLKKSRATVTQWAVFAIAMIGILVMYGRAQEQDAAYARLQAIAAADCKPTKPRELASAYMLPNGTIECAISSRKMGSRKVVRSEY